MAGHEDVEAELAALIERYSRGDLAQHVRLAGTPPRPHPRLAPGQRWDGERGHIRWRLSASARRLVRMEDEADLTGLIGADAATPIVRGFLGIRPAGGRVWSDANGDAVVQIGDKLIYLGRIPSVGDASEWSESGGGDLGAAVLRVLHDSPGSTCREIVYQLRLAGRLTDKASVNSLLYRDKRSFVSDGGATPRWRAVAPPSSGLARPSAGTPIRQTRERPTTQANNAYAGLVRTASRPPRDPTPTVAVASRTYGEPALALMEWQLEAMQCWYARGCQGIVEAVTGTGKTHLGLEAVEHARRDGQKSTVLVPSVDLQDQWIERFERFLPHVAIARVGGKRSGDPARADVTIAVINSAVKQDLASLSDDSLLVADEVHRYGSTEFRYALRGNYARRLGLTATLERSGDDAVEEILLPYFRSSILTVGFDRAIREEVVAPFRLVMAPVALTEGEQADYDTVSHTLSNALKVLRAAGAFKGGGASIVQELGRLGGAGGRIGTAARSAQSAMRERRRLLAGLSGKVDAVEELAELIERSMGTVVFTQSKEVAEEVSTRLRGWNIAASALHSDMAVGERRDALAGLARGRLQALAAPKLLDEGIDVPTVDLGIVMTASRSRRQMVQRLGRVIRKKADGRPVNFVIIFAKDTVEDPSSGVHEGFFDLVGDVASRKVSLDLGWNCDDIPD